MSSIHDLIAKLCPSGVCFKRLGDVARIKNGKDHKTLADGKYPVYGSGGIMRYANSYAYDKPSVLIGFVAQSQSAELVASRHE